METSRTFAFVFPMASGHINPSLGVARSLVERGHKVHYLCRRQMQEAIEDTGATYHSDLENQGELYNGREPAMIGAIGALQAEYGMADQGYVQGRVLLKEIMAEMMLPGTVRWIASVAADVVVCDPLVNLEAALAARLAGLPCASILTLAGPGGSQPAWRNMLDAAGTTAEAMLEKRREFQPLTDCLKRLAAHGLHLSVEDGLKPVGLLPPIVFSDITLVTTAEFLADEVPSDLQAAYDDAKVKFAYVGPLLDKPGAKRAAGHRIDHVLNEQAPVAATLDPVALIQEAKSAGRKVILASLGTIITGDNPELGWNARPVLNGVRQGLTGKELCQAAWGAVFDIFGSDSEDPEALILVALGPQPDALDGVPAPRNAFCQPILPQVDVLRAGVDVFLTHGGQNSLMESLSTSTPVVVCPGFGDQPENAAKAQALGVGLKVDRPMGPLERSFEEAFEYRQSVASCLAQVRDTPAFREKAKECAEALGAAGGVPRATAVLLELAHKRVPAKSCADLAPLSDELMARRAAAGA
mmetsp:Transcript_42836/g.99794  ORF Transcript_42836/g.99794 Transcript_42836/m.99794 type:complete len:527 (+) Transcript_42836:91-1671(+)